MTNKSNAASMFSKHKASLFISVLISAVILTYFFRTVDFADFWNMVISISPFWIGLFVALAVVNIWLRALRYKVLIGPSQVTLGELTLVTLVRNCTVDLFPHRLGELSYVFILNHRYNLPLKSAASSFILAVIFDFIAVAPIIIVSLLFVELESSLYLFVILGGVTFAITVVYLLPFFISLASRFLTPFLKGKIQIKVSAFLESTAQEVRIAKQRKIYLPVFILSLLIRVIKYVTLFFLAAAFFETYGIDWRELHFSHVVLGTIGAELTSFLPIKGLAGLGTWEAAWAVVMKMLGYPAEWGITTGLGVHLSTQIFEYLIGGIALIVIYWRKPHSKQTKEV